ncbi:uncharacterized protein LOC143920430 [Arctopsyche grandis]|uniref:uncharacterized protein LOC143920430 n=1 Tax=Arctopsyche grandis TaxID=121162 RepID=UPI00406D8F15
MKSLLVLFLVAICSAAKLSSNQEALSGASSSDDGNLLSANIPNEYPSSSTKQRSGKKFNATTPLIESTYQTQTTPIPNQYYSTTPKPQIQRAYYIEPKSANQQYLAPEDTRNSFNVIPQDTKITNQHFLPPLKQEYNIQPPATQYIPPEQIQYIPSSAEQFVNDQNSIYQQYKHYNDHPQQDNQLQVQYLPATSNVEDNNQKSSYQYFNPIDLHELSQSAQSFESKRTSKESIQRQNNELSSSQVSRRYDASSPAPQIQYQQQDPMASASSYYSMFTPQQEQNYSSKINYNQYQDQTYQTAQPPVYTTKANYNQYQDQTYQTTQPPVYTTKSNNNQYQDQSYPTTQPPVYTTKTNYNQYQDQSYQTTKPQTYTTKANNNYQDHTYQTTQHSPLYNTKTNYNQYQDNVYQTTQPPVVQIGHNSDLPKWLNYAPSFVNRQDTTAFETTKIPPVQIAQSRKSTLYGDKLQQYPQQQQQSFASSRSSNVPVISVPQTIITPAPEKLADHLPYSSKFIPQTPSQFKVPQQIYQQEIPQNPYQEQNAYTRNFQNPTAYQPISSTEPMPILKQTSEMDIDGSFSYETLTGDQTHIMQRGYIENKGTDHEEQVMQGSYSFVGDDGRTYTVTYIADANGFRATGDHIPTAPPIPDVIQRSIELNLAEEAAHAEQNQQQQQGYQYPKVDGNNHYAVVEQARERSSIPYVPNYNNNVINSNDYVKY